MIHRIQEKSEPHDLDRLFDRLNKEAFDSEIHKDFPVRYGALKVKYGMCNGTLHWEHERQRYYAVVKEIVITNFYKMDDKLFEGIMLHEIIHAWCMQQGYYKDEHGPHFLSMLHSLEQKGYDIPLSEDIGRMEVDAKNLKKNIYGVIYTKPNKDKYIMLFRYYDQAMLDRKINFKDMNKDYIFIATKNPTVLRYPVARDLMTLRSAYKLDEKDYEALLKDQVEKL